MKPNEYNMTLPHPEAESERLQYERRRLSALRADTAERTAPRLGDDMTAFRINRAYDAEFEHKQGWRPDPRRNVATHWKKLMLQRQGGMLCINREPNGDPTDPHIFDGETGPFKVRWLMGAKAGQVEDVPVHLYIQFRKSDGTCREAEPTPDDEPLCPPDVPIGVSIPSSFIKAQTMAAKKGQDPVTVTWEEVKKHFIAKYEARKAAGWIK